MAVTADRIVVEIEADVNRATANVKAWERSIDGAMGRAGKSAKIAEAQIRKSADSISSSMKGLAASFAAYFSGRELMGLVDGFTRVQNALKVAGLEGDNLKSVQGELLNLSSRYGVSLEELARLYGNSSQAASDLGASQAQLVSLTEFTAQSLKITGTNAAQAQGAILGLTQALASGTVRAEEFNQINEGGLRPLLQVVANTEKYGGSIAKLRKAITDGKVTSQEFFADLMNGAAELEGKAAKATLTLSGAFEALNSRLMVYFGEADKSNGVSVALATAIGALADNLGTVIPAIAAIATGYGAYALAANGAAIATGGLTAALTVLSKHPVAIAVAAIVAGIVFFTTKANEATEETKRLAAQQDALAQVMKSDQAAKLAKDAKALAAARSGLTTETLKLALAEAQLQMQQAKRKIELARQGKGESQVTTWERDPNGWGVRRVTKPVQVDLSPSEVKKAATDAAAQARAAAESASATRRAWEDLKKTASSGPAATVAGETEAERKKRLAAEKKAAREAEQASREALQRRQEERADQIEILRARADLTSSIEDAADLEREMLALERAQRQDDLNSRTDLSKKEREARQAAIDALYGTGGPGKVGPDGEIIADAGKPGLLQRRVNMDLRDKQAREALDLTQAELDNQRDTLSAQLALTDDREMRRDLELRLLDLAYQQEEADLQAVRASETATEAQKKIAEERLKILGQLKGLEAASIDRSNESPLAGYARGLDKTRGQLADQVENYVIDELEAVQDSITSAVTKKLGVKDPFLSGLIEMFIQQQLIRPIAEALAGVGGGGMGGGIIGAVGGILGFASGGSMSIGGRGGTDRNVLSLNGRPIANVSRGETLSVGSKALSARGGATVVQPIIQVDARGAVMNDQFANMILAQAAQTSVQTAAAMGQQVNAGIPARLAKYNRDGT